jgi:hypothetical protein
MASSPSSENNSFRLIHIGEEIVHKSQKFKKNCLPYVFLDITECTTFGYVVFAVRMTLSLVAYEGVSKRFRTGRPERELQMVQLSATRCSCIAIL